MTKLKKNLVYETKLNLMYQNEQGQMQYRERIVVFRKGEISHIARIVTYVDIKNGKAKLISLLTNDYDMDIETVIEIYKRRWQIETLFKQIKQNFPNF